MLLVPVLMTACASAGGSSGADGVASAGSGASAAPASSRGNDAGTDLYRKYPTGTEFCALVGLKEVTAAMQATKPYTTVRVTKSPVECTYSGGSVRSIVTVVWSPEGAGQLDNFIELSPKTKPVAIDVGGHAGRSLQGDVQVVVDGAAIDVFGVGSPDLHREAALAAAFLAKVE